MNIIIYGDFYSDNRHANRYDNAQWNFWNYIQKKSKFPIFIKDITENVQSICNSNSILIVISGAMPDISKLKPFTTVYDYEDVSCRCSIRCRGNDLNCRSRRGLEYVKKFDHIMYRFHTYITVEQFKNKSVIKMPWYIDNNVFYDHRLEKKYDILFYGNYWDKAYPLRAKLYNILKNHGEINSLILERDLTNKDNMLTGEKLSKLINQSWLTVATKSINNLFLRKYSEIAFSGSVVIGNYPDLEPRYFDSNMIYIDDHMTDEQIVAKIKEALADKERLREMANNMYHFFTNNFEYKNGLERFDNFIDDIVKKNNLISNS